MDATRFDTFTRLVAAGASRRTALRALAGAGAAMGLAQAVSQEALACAGEKEHCYDTPCCHPLLCNGTCQKCIRSDGPCAKSEDCCDKGVCKHGVCKKSRKKVKCDGNGCKKKKKH